MPVILVLLMLPSPFSTRANSLLLSHILKVLMIRTESNFGRGNRTECVFVNSSFQERFYVLSFTVTMLTGILYSSFTKVSVIQESVNGL